MSSTLDDAGLIDVLQRAARSSQGSHPYMAFSASPTLREGLLQAGRMVSDLAPARMVTAYCEEGLWIGFESTDPKYPLPNLLLASMLVYLLELARNATAVDVVPLEVRLPQGTGVPERWAAFFQRFVEVGPRPRMLLSPVALKLPHVSASSAVLAYVTERHCRRFRMRYVRGDTSARVLRASLRGHLIALDAESIATALGASREDLEQQLEAEGESLEALLSEARSEAVWGTLDEIMTGASAREPDDAELFARVIRARQIVQAAITAHLA